MCVLYINIMYVNREILYSDSFVQINLSQTHNFFMFLSHIDGVPDVNEIQINNCSQWELPNVTQSCAMTSTVTLNA